MKIYFNLIPSERLGLSPEMCENCIQNVQDLNVKGF